jgi:hypothetical protein
MRKIDLLALVVVLGGTTQLAAPAGATYLASPYEDLFKYCCQEKETQKCCFRSGCEVTPSGCRAVEE